MRYQRSAAARVRGHIGTWPGERSASGQAAARANGTLTGSPSFQHAGKVWAECLHVLVQQAVGMGDHVEAMADLGFCSLLGTHLTACQRCWVTGPYDSRTPVEWIMWGCGRRPGLAAIVGPILADSGVKMRGRAPG